VQSAPEAPATQKYPLPVTLDKYIEKPYLNRASVPVDVNHPNGIDEPAELKASEYSVLQKHCKFFDSNDDDVISLSETYRGFRRLGFSWIISAISIVMIHSLMSWPTQPRFVFQLFLYSRSNLVRIQCKNSVIQPHREDCDLSLS